MLWMMVGRGRSGFGVTVVWRGWGVFARVVRGWHCVGVFGCGGLWRFVVFGCVALCSRCGFVSRCGFAQRCELLRVCVCVALCVCYITLHCVGCCIVWFV